MCTGALILGAIGLLTGVPATTYSASRAYLRDTFGAVLAEGRLVESGKIITAVWVSATAVSQLVSRSGDHLTVGVTASACSGHL